MDKVYRKRSPVRASWAIQTVQAVLGRYCVPSNTLWSGALNRPSCLQVPDTRTGTSLFRNQASTETSLKLSVRTSLMEVFTLTTFSLRSQYKNAASKSIQFALQSLLSALWDTTPAKQNSPSVTKF